jgi:integrase
MTILAECPNCHHKLARKRKVCKCGQSMDKAKKAQKVKYWINYKLPNGRYSRENINSFEDLNGYSIEDAEAALAKRRVDKIENPNMFDIKVDTKMTFNELTKWYLGLEKVKDMASYDTICISLKKFNMVFGSRIVSKVRPADLENYQAMRQRAGMADATIDHEIGKTKTMIFKAFDNGMVSPDTLRTFRKVKKLLVKDSDVRHRIISPDEFKALMKHSKGHIKDIIAMGYYTGMRRGEILGLTWDKVDFSMRMIRLESTDLKTARLGMFQFAPSYLGYCKKCQTDFMQTARTIMYSSIKGGQLRISGLHCE